MYTREYILERLNAMAEKNYADFSTALIPGEKRMLGVRIPGLRAFAREIARNDYRDYFANAGVLEDSSLPDDIISCRKKDIFDIKGPYFEEYALTGFVIGYIKADLDYVIRLVAAFVPEINNWSVNDTFCATLKITEKNRKKMWDFLVPYLKSGKEFQIRFATVMLMDYYLTEEYIEKVLDIYDGIRHDGYYVKMGVAWGIATAYAKFPDITHRYMKNSGLDDFTYNKAIQKMLESNRVCDDAKKILRTMKRSNSQ